MIVSIAVPCLFLYYNGIKAEQWGEQAFCIIFMFFFLFLGKSLAFQKLTIEEIDGNLCIDQTLRTPFKKFSLELKELKSIKISERLVNNHNHYVLWLVTDSNELEVYQTISKSEADQIEKAIKNLIQSLAGG